MGFLQKEDKVLVDLLVEFSKSDIGKVDLVEYRLNEQDKRQSQRVALILNKGGSNMTGEINQCDGCARGLPVEDVIHMGGGYDLIGCTKNRYVAQDEIDCGCESLGSVCPVCEDEDQAVSGANSYFVTG